MPSNETSTRTESGRLGLALRVAVTALLLGLIFRAVDLTGVVATIGQVDPLLLLAGLAAQAGSMLLGAWRWYRVMYRLRYPMAPAFYLRSYLKGSFFNQALPTSIGGDALRVLDVAGEGFRKLEALGGVLVDRALGLAGLLLLTALALVGNGGLLPAEASVALGLIAGGGLTGFLLLTRFSSWGLHARLPFARPLHALSRRLAQVLSSAGESGLQVFLSVAVHLMSALAVFCVGRALGLEYGLGTFLVLVPPAILVTVVPISVAGWGVREGALIGLFSLVGAPQTPVLSMSLLYGVLLIVVTLPGFVIFLIGRRRAAVTGEAA